MRCILMQKKRTKDDIKLISVKLDLVTKVIALVTVVITLILAVIKIKQ